MFTFLVSGFEGRNIRQVIIIIMDQKNKGIGKKPCFHLATF